MYIYVRMRIYIYNYIYTTFYTPTYRYVYCIRITKLLFRIFCCCHYQKFPRADWLETWKGNEADLLKGKE